MEYITANGTKYECQTVTSGANQIAFEMQGQEIAAIAAAFKEVTVLTVSPEEGAAYGTYKNLSFESATVYEAGSYPGHNAYPRSHRAVACGLRH